MKIEYIEGDLFAGVKEEKDPVFICHVCNCLGGWGAGFVIPLAKHFPLAREEYLKSHAANELVLGQTQFVEVREQPAIVVCNMIAQTLGGERPLYYNHLACCMDAVAADVPRKIVAPLFGSGLAGGDWNIIEQLIIDCWIKQEIPVTIYYLPGTLPKNWKLPNG
jgi:hypothetical protein